MTDRDDWVKTCRAFRRIAAAEGVANVAAEIPADPVTVYRLIGGVTERPTRAVRAGIERIVASHENPETKP